MTTLPAPRPIATPPAPRPPGGPGASMGPAIDPVKLLKKYKWLLGGASVLGAVLGLAAHFAFLSLYPIFTASMIYEAVPQQVSVEAAAPPAGFEKEIEKFMASQVAVMMSERVADRTVADPLLPREAPRFAQRFTVNGTFDAVEASRQLQKRLRAGVVPETYLIRVSYWDTDKETAVAVLRLVGQTYSRLRSTMFQNESAERKDQINQQIAELTRTVEQQQTARRRLLQDQSVDSLDTVVNEANSRMRAIQEQLIKIRNDASALTVRRDKMRRDLESPAGITYDDDIRKRVEDQIEMVNSKQRLNTLEGALMAAKTRLGPAHRDVKRFETEVEGARAAIERDRQRMMREEFDADLSRFDSALASAQASEQDLLKRFEEAQTRAVELTQTMTRVKDLDADIQRLQETVGKLRDGLKTFDVLTGQGRESRVREFQPAMAPKSLTFPRLSVMIPLGVILVAGLTGAVVVLREVLDQRVKSPADVALIPRARLAGLIPHASEDPSSPEKIESVFRDQPRGVLAESYRQLRSLISKRMHQGGHKSLLVMSGMPGSGATTVALNLAHAFAAAEHRVLLIDANLRRPTIHKHLGLREGPGLADALAGLGAVEELVQDGGNPNLSVLVAGTPDKRVYERLSSQAMADLLAAAGPRYDVILLDVAPGIVAGDGVALAHRCDATLLVVRAMGEKRGMVARLRSELGETRAEFMGVLVNAVRAAAGGYLKGNILATHAYENGKGNDRDKDKDAV